MINWKLRIAKNWPMVYQLAQVSALNSRYADDELAEHSTTGRHAISTERTSNS
jgi:hypothetical protein